MNDVLVNQQLSPLNIDLNKSILISWDMKEQLSYTLSIVDQTNTIVFQKECRSSTNSLEVSLPDHPDRRVYNVRLHCLSRHSVRDIEGKFYTTNKHHQGSWITRLDNPIIKEKSFFDEKRNIRLKKTIYVNKKNTSGIIDICGLGFYTLFVNRKKVSKGYLNNALSVYDKVVYYDSYDLTQYLVKGENEIEVELADGWYNPAPILILGKYNIRKQLSIGKPCLWCEVQLYSENKQEIVISDNSWESTYGNYLQNNIYIGETITDVANKEKKAKTVKIPGPTGKLIPNFIPKIKRTECLTPKVKANKKNIRIYDFGEIISGHFYCEFSEAYQGKISISYAEELDDVSNAKYDSTISGIYGIEDKQNKIDEKSPIIQCDVIEKQLPTPFLFENQYTYHSFRYVVVEFCNADMNDCVDNYIKTVKAYRVHTDVRTIAEINTSSDTLNRIWHAGNMTRLNNIHSFFEDCTRERFGYGGDIVALLSTQIATLDIQSVVEKVLYDFARSQNTDGGIPATAPFVGIMTNGTSNRSGALGWQLAFPKLALSLIDRYDDYSSVIAVKENLTKHLSYLMDFDFDYISQCCLGDWGAIDERIVDNVIVSPDQAFCSSCMYVIILQNYMKLIEYKMIDEICGEKVQKVIDKSIECIIDRFQKEKVFGSGTVSSYIFAMKANLIPEYDIDEWMNDLAKKIQTRKGIFSFGIFGMSWAYELLSQYGYQHLIYDWLIREEAPSYSSMLATGNGTLMEHFPNPEIKHTYQGSLNHAMFSSYGAWFVKDLLGIVVSKKTVILQPAIVLPLEFVEGKVEIEAGTIEMRWERIESLIAIEVHLPEDVRYEFKLPNNSETIKEEVDLINGKRVISSSIQIKTS